jgi:hypothetical protein
MHLFAGDILTVLEKLSVIANMSVAMQACK